ncbi:hypothetical protein [Clostridium estertheticum]|uniref:hypothetical protein n=1 Tax=Clostridium estertheticum TaxID=238834 RepID=UPI001C7DFB5C|nr:hypothetical protein [Clostridium estertheticum]MBX4269209.1 hypothetical protein [Clostridium estertheticum]WLC79433.1 hypothetical protein KTC98_20025 [Clostridium estertheticum]
MSNATLANIKNALLSTKVGFYIEPNENKPNTFHIHVNGVLPISIPTKDNSKLLDREPVFGHIESFGANEVRWLETSNRSGSVWGHVCIQDIYNSLIDKNNHIIDVLDLPNIVNRLNKISISNVTIADMEPRAGY